MDECVHGLGSDNLAADAELPLLSLASQAERGGIVDAAVASGIEPTELSMPDVDVNNTTAPEKGVLVVDSSNALLALIVCISIFAAMPVAPSTSLAQFLKVHIDSTPGKIEFGFNVILERSLLMSHASFRCRAACPFVGRPG